MNIQSYLRSLAFALIAVAVAFGFIGSPVRAQAIEPSSATPGVETGSNANLAMTPDTLFCVMYKDGDETCISEVALVASEESAVGAVDEPVPAISELASSATESASEIDSPSLFWADAIKVAISQSVTIAAPGQEVESTVTETTGSLPSDAAAGEPNNAPEAAEPVRNGAD